MNLFLNWKKTAFALGLVFLSVFTKPAVLYQFALFNFLITI